MCVGRFIVLAIMSYRDIRFRIVLDSDIAWLAFFNTLPLLLSRVYPNNVSLPPALVFYVMSTRAQNNAIVDPTVPIMSPLPLWIAHLLFLALSTGGALLLLFASFLLRHLTSREVIGTGDILFTFAAGLGSDYKMSFHMVILAFVLAMPAAVIIKCAKRDHETIAFIPFLTLAYLCLWLF